MFKGRIQREIGILNSELQRNGHVQVSTDWSPLSPHFHNFRGPYIQYSAAYGIVMIPCCPSHVLGGFPPAVSTLKIVPPATLPELVPGSRSCSQSTAPSPSVPRHTSDGA